MIGASRCRRLGGALACALMLVDVGVSQDDAPSSRAETDSKVDATTQKAVTLVRLLELQARRSDSATKLVAMGAAAVPALVGGLDHPDPEILDEVVMILRALGEDARGAVPALQRIAGETDSRRAYAARWALGSLRPQGILLVVDSHADQVVEFAMDGTVRLVLKDLQGVLDGERLPNGRYLVAMPGEGVQEIDVAGKVHWEFQAKASSATRLPGGRTLICDQGNGRVIEVDSKGVVTRTIPAARAYAAERLTDGNILIAEVQGRGVIEIDPSGEVAWHGKATIPLSMQRFDNGNTLIAVSELRQVVEFDPESKRVWTMKLDKRPYSALRSRAGDLFVGGKGFIRRYNSEETQIGQFGVTFARRIKLY